MKTIVVATDYSRAASNALAYAAALASHQGAKLVLFNAYQLPPPAANLLLGAQRREGFIAENKARLESLARQTASLYGIEVAWSSKVSYITEELDAQAKSLSADLVVVGMRNRRETQGIFGNSTTSILQQASRPILVVPEEASFRGIDKILFACDYKALAADNKLLLLHEVALAFNARVQVLHVEKEAAMMQVAGLHQESYLYDDELESILASVNLDPVFGSVRHEYKYLADDDVVRGINRGATDFGADLLVMVPHKANFWDILLERSHTCKVALSTHVPLLALPNK